MLVPGRLPVGRLEPERGEAVAQVARQLVQLAQRARLHVEAPRPRRLRRAAEVLLLAQVAPYLGHDQHDRMKEIGLKKQAFYKGWKLYLSIHFGFGKMAVSDFH